MEPVKAYLRNVKFYETDCMKIVHHSNYIRWFEEARIDFFDRIGAPYSKFESMGFVSPVLEVSCRYRSMTRFGDNVWILLKLSAFDGIRFHFEYTVRDAADGTVRALGESTHCFVDVHGRPVSFKRKFPDYYSTLSQFVGMQTAAE